jgi:predicted nucleic acid-binding protein
MRIVLDTNVFISGIYFTDPPSDILKAYVPGPHQVVQVRKCTTHSISG